MEKRKVNFENYYKNVKHAFSSKNRGDYERFLGDYSEEEAYIDAYIMVNHEPVSVLTFLEEWFHTDDYGTMLIYGEPCSGKTTLCKKAVVEFCNGNYLKGLANSVLIDASFHKIHRRILVYRTPQ